MNLACLTTDTTVCATGHCPVGTDCVTLVDGSQGCVQLDVCGNRYLDPGEACDDGNRVDRDGCSADCSSDETCGNGVVDEGEDCDCGAADVPPSAGCLGQQNSAAGGLCNADCRLHCGDGQLAPDEECEGSLVRVGFQCSDLGYDFGHMRCAPACGGLDFTDCGTYEWRPMASPTSTWIRGLWGSAPDDIWAIGTYGLILHYDGAAWTIADSPTQARLRSIWGSAPDDIFAVGDLGAMLHYDGAAWREVAPPTSENLRKVWGLSRDRVYAVGESGTILTYDGQTWQTMDSTVTTTLRDIWGPSPDELHAVGSFGTILEYDGLVWREVFSPTGESVQNLWGDAASGQIFAVANGGVVLRHDGVGWTIFLDDPNLVTEDLIAIWADSPDELYVVGEGGTTLRYTRGAWQVMNSPTTADLDGLWGSAAGDVFAGGENGVLLQLDRVTWRPVPSNTTRLLRAVWGSAADDVFIVGSRGTILHYDGDVLTPMTAPTSENLRSVWGAAPNDVYAVGECATVLHYDGSAWNALTPPVADDLHAVWGGGPNDIFMAGDDGVLLRYTGTEFQTLRSPTRDALHGLSGVGQSDVLASGENGALLHYDGSDWRWVGSHTSDPLYGVWGLGAELFVVGENGLAMVRQGGSFVTIPTPPPTDWLRGVSGTSASDVFAVGETGTVLHYDGVTWAPVRTDENSNFYAVWAAPTGEVMVVGSGGLVYSYERKSRFSTELATTCGDLRLEYGEACDDGNQDAGDGCDSACRREPVCGNRVREVGEDCDDGNALAGDGCDAGCQLEARVETEPNEDGDPEPGGIAVEGNDFSPANADGPFTDNAVVLASLEPAGDEDVFEISNLETMTRTVRVATYNIDFGIDASCNTSLDTVVHIRDDQGVSLAHNDNRNRTLPDFCSTVAYQLAAGQTVYAHVSDFADDATWPVPRYVMLIEFVARCGDGVVEGAEECEAGMPTPDGNCNDRCLLDRACGDGAAQGHEHCDDGNLAAGDGCSPDCTLELAAATPIAAPNSAIGFSGSLGPGDWRWARPDADCSPTWPADHYLDVFSVQNDTTEAQELTVTANWIDTDGHIHVYADPLDPTSVNGCMGGDDEFGVFGSQMTDVPVAPGETVHIMASTYGSATAVAAYTIDVVTQPANQCTLP